MSSLLSSCLGIYIFASLSACKIAAAIFDFASDWLADQFFQRDLEFPVGDFKFHAHHITSLVRYTHISRTQRCANTKVFAYASLFALKLYSGSRVLLPDFNTNGGAGLVRVVTTETE